MVAPSGLPLYLVSTSVRCGSSYRLEAAGAGQGAGEACANRLPGSSSSWCVLRGRRAARGYSFRLGWRDQPSIRAAQGLPKIAYNLRYCQMTMKISELVCRDSGVPNYAISRGR